MEQQRALTHADVERIIQLAEDSAFGYVHFEADGLEVELVKEGYVGAAGQAASAPAPAAPAATAVSAPRPEATVAAAATIAPTSAPASAPTAAPATGEASDADDVDGNLIRSPMVGIFYRSPDPESPPYVEVGQTVEPGATVGLVEVMKMFTAIRTEVGGRVDAVLADNAAQVDRGQPLIRVVEG